MSLRAQMTVGQRAMRRLGLSSVTVQAVRVQQGATYGGLRPAFCPGSGRTLLSPIASVWQHLLSECRPAGQQLARLLQPSPQTLWLLPYSLSSNATSLKLALVSPFHTPPLVYQHILHISTENLLFALWLVLSASHSLVCGARSLLTPPCSRDPLPPTWSIWQQRRALDHPRPPPLPRLSLQGLVTPRCQTLLASHSPPAQDWHGPAPGTLPFPWEPTPPACLNGFLLHLRIPVQISTFELRPAWATV